VSKTNELKNPAKHCVRFAARLGGGRKNDDQSQIKVLDELKRSESDSS
jgi:hypothetical protein